ncbi:MAG: NAD(P)H-binding protein [Flavobacterium sp.]
MKALVIGATGATGKDLVGLLLKDHEYNEVVLFVRRSTGINHPKLKEIITDFSDWDKISDAIQGDVWFSCLGTTLKIAGSKEKQKEIDYGIPARFAETAKANGIQKVVLLSAYGASASSKVFYSKIKGELEDKIRALQFNSLIIFRPGVLVRNNTDRVGESISIGILEFLNRLGILRKFKPLPTSLLAEKLVKASKSLSPGEHITELDKVFQF